MKRAVAIIIIICILSLLVAIPTSAQGEVFVAVGNTVLPLTDAMPIKSNGAWYVDYRCFSEGTLNISASYNATEKKLVLYNWDTTLIFDLDTSTAQTVSDKVEYKAVTVAAAGTVYVPAKFTAQIFGLEATYHSRISLLRIMRPNDIPYSMFQYIAKNAMPELLEKYNSQKKAEAENQQPVTDNRNPNNEVVKNRTLRLTVNITEGESFAKVLNQLSQRGFRATFFIDQSAIPNCENEIRRAIVQGHSVGILASSPDDLSTTNAKLFDISKTKTRLVRFKNGSAALSKEDVERVISAGYRLWDYDISPTGTSASRMYSNAVSRLKSSTRSPVLAISDSEMGLTVLGRILNYLDSENYGTYIINLLDTPINQISERR